MSRLWSALAAGITPYTPGEQPKEANLVKLNTNENPYPPSPKAIEALSAVAPMRLALYPDPESAALREAIARVHGVSMDEVFAGNGSDEVLGLIFPAYFERETPIRFADITYSFYPVYAALFGMKCVEIPLNDDFSMPIARFYNAPGGVIIANPNAPTGLALSEDAIRGILSNNERIVVVDEAYIDFGAKSVIPLIREYENLIVVRTLSKSHSLAGLRVGYAVANAATLEALFRVKNSFNSYPLDALAQAAAAASISDTRYFEETRGKIIETRARFVKEMRAFGFYGPESSANFVFMRHESLSGEAVQKLLRASGVIVRRFDKPRIRDYLRITIGAPEQMQRLLDVLRANL